jgi:hypothetical protein
MLAIIKDVTNFSHYVSSHEVITGDRTIDSIALIELIPQDSYPLPIEFVYQFMIHVLLSLNSN